MQIQRRTIQMVSLLLSFNAHRPKDSIVRLKVSHKPVVQFSYGLGMSCVYNGVTQLSLSSGQTIKLPDVALVF